MDEGSASGLRSWVMALLDGSRMPYCCLTSAGIGCRARARRDPASTVIFAVARIARLEAQPSSSPRRLVWQFQTLQERRIFDFPQPQLGQARLAQRTAAVGRLFPQRCGWPTAG
jgi:hypothetical protein